MIRSQHDPAVQLRQALAVSKRQGIPFDIAWKYAYGNLNGPHDTEHRRQWRVVLTELRWAFEAAYAGEAVPGGEALQRLSEALAQDADSDAEFKPIRTPPPKFDSQNEGKNMGISFIPGRNRDAA